MQPIIFMDLDGVLVDLRKGLSEKVGKKLDFIHSDEFVTIFKNYVHNLSFGHAVQFWAELPPTEGYLELWQSVKYYKPLILTSVSNKLPAIYGKELWCRKYLEIDSSRIFCSKNSKEKKYYASKKSLLVDDFIDNVEEFVAAGGSAIHHVETASTIEQINSFIQKHSLYPSVSDKTL